MFSFTKYTDFKTIFLITRFQDEFSHKYFICDLLSQAEKEFELKNFLDQLIFLSKRVSISSFSELFLLHFCSFLLFWKIQAKNSNYWVVLIFTYCISNVRKCDSFSWYWIYYRALEILKLKIKILSI